MVSTRDDKVEESPAKRIKLDGDLISKGDSLLHAGERRNGVAPVKPEYLVYPTGSKKDPTKPTVDDDAAEASIHADERKQSDVRKKRSKAKGQNTSRDFGSSRDILPLCSTRVLAPEFSPPDCPYGDKCRFEHNLRKYLAEGKRKDIDTLENGLCPVYEAHGSCPAGFKCRFAGSHTEERVLEDGRKELVLKEDASRKASFLNHSGGVDRGTVNVVSSKQKINLNKRKVKTPKSDQYIEWLDVNFREMKKHFHTSKEALEEQKAADTATDSPTDPSISKEENRAMYTEPPFLPSEKRRIYYGPETPILAPLTTQGNLPFRRLCVESGAAITFSEMAMSIPLLQGLKPEWALLKAHYAETTPPSFEAKGSVVQGYDNAKDLKFGAQICATTPWQAIKATEVLHQHCPHLRVIDLNCGCPIDMVYKAGGGSALLDNPGKLEKIVRGMNTVSGEIPVTTKIRMGTLTDRPTALKLVERLTLGGHESQEIGLSPCGVAAITLHGRSRQQRYTKLADWEYISECAALIKRTKEKATSITDTLREGDARNQPNGNKGFPYMIGNGDCYSHVDYFEHLQEAKVDSVMIARGALIKPWIFEEIKLGQYLDKSASQRLDLIKDYVKYGLDSWGSDEMGVGLTRRFLLEWLSFAHRYVPIGLLEYLPPKLQDRPPAFKGRSDLETLLASDDFKDWIKISEMFLGPAHKDFRFEPKHKSNSYEIDAEG